MSFVSAVGLNVGLVLCRYAAISIFTSDPGVVVYASERMVTVLLFQGIACYYEMAGASMRGLGYSMTPALITIFGTCVLRLLWVWCFHGFNGEFTHLLMVYPVSWTLTDVAMAVAYTRIWHKLRVENVKGLGS